MTDISKLDMSKLIFVLLKFTLLTIVLGCKGIQIVADIDADGGDTDTTTGHVISDASSDTDYETEVDSDHDIDTQQDSESEPDSDKDTDSATGEDSDWEKDTHHDSDFDDDAGCGDVIWDSNLAITSNSELDALEGYTYITGFLSIDEPDDDIENLEKLSELICIGGKLEIEENAKLQDLDGLHNLSRLEGSLTIVENQLLGSLDGLDNLKVLEGDFLKITQNASLPTCEAIALQERLVAQGFSGAICIKGNLADGCLDHLKGCGK